MVPVKTGYTWRVFVWFVRPYFISPHLLSSPLQCLLASFLSLLYLCCFLFAFSEFFIWPPPVFFLDGCISISLRTVSFPGGSWSLQAWMFDYYILPVFCVCSSLAPLLTRAVPFFSVFVTARNTFHVRLWHPAMTAPSVSWRLWRVLVSICYPVLRVANHVLSGTEPPGHFFQACHVDGRKFLPKKRRNCSAF